MKYFILGFTLMIFSGCNETLQKSGSSIGPGAQDALGIVSYSRIQAQVLTPYCTQCHGQSGGVNLETYENTLAHRERIRAAIQSGAMPPRGSFPPELRDYLIAWIEAGAPEPDTLIEIRPPPSPTPVSSPIGELTYANIRGKVFEPFCIRCHNSTRGAAGVQLDQYEKAYLKLDVIQWMVETEQMPPSGPLQQDARDLLLRWIAAGAPEGPPTPTPTPNPRPTPPPANGAVPDYASVRMIVFQPFCFSCHGNGRSSGGVSLDTYNSTKQVLSLIDFAVDTDQMPMGSTLPPDLKSYVLTWVRAGGPEHTNNPAPTPTPRPPPAPVPLAPTYASLKANIFSPKCLMCHAPGGMANHIRFDDYQAMIRNSWLFDRRRPSRSEIIEAVTERADKRMPPRQSGLDPLTGNEVSALTDWIARGLPER